MQIGIISLFPEMFQSLNVGITGRAIKNGLLTVDCWNPRDYTKDKHKSVDDKPYGGGPGMVMMAEPLKASIHAAKAGAKNDPCVIYLSPQGRVFDQEAAMEFTSRKSIILIAGRYEGIDQRIIEKEVDEEWSIGNYILSGGELAAMVIIDALTRLIPGAVGDENSVSEDSLTNGLLKYPQYTRPEVFAGTPVPEVLLSGNHKLINEWRLKSSLGKTWLRRPNLLYQNRRNDEELNLLAEFIEDFLKAVYR